MRDVVKKGYNKGDYAGKYARKSLDIDNFEKAMIEELLKSISQNSLVLDLGCGVGLPYDGYIVKKGFEVKGIDISEKHIELAKKNVPQADYSVNDFFTEFKEKFDAIISFYAIFHIPRDEHLKLFKKIHSDLKENGYILLTLGLEDMKNDVNPDFAGAKMMWSSYDGNKNKELIEKAGFKILLSAEDKREENHLFILARKI